MKKTILLLAIVAILASSCQSMYPCAAYGTKVMPVDMKHQHKRR